MSLPHRPFFILPSMKSLIVLLALAFAGSLSAQTFKISADSSGIVIDGGAHGHIVLGAPAITGSDKKARKPVFAAAADGASATATYADGFVITIVPSSKDGTILYSFDQKPEDAVSILITATLPLSYNNGGTFATNGGAAQPFPAEPGKQLFAQGSFTKIDFHTGTGEGLSIAPPASYQQMQDPRAWGLQHFQWIYHYDLNRYPNATSFTLKVTPVKTK
jgi:hypothetical protein